MKKRLYALVLLLAFFCATPLAFSQVSTPAILSSDMVLQQGMHVPIWGTAAPNERVEVTFAGQRLQTRADRQGRWSVELAPLAASKSPHSLTIKGRRNTIVFDNVLVGEVWLCSGQSNMEYTMKLNSNFALPAKGENLAAQELARPANPLIRVFHVDRRRAAESVWKVADGESLAPVSAPGYFFGKNIQEELDVPVGIISSSIGGTRIEPWTPLQAYQESPLFSAQLQTNEGQIDGADPGRLYDYMIAPLAPYALKGFLWYQGESNCSQRDRQYAQKYQTLVDSWRSAFRLPEAPFYSVLLAPHIYSDRLHKGVAVTAEELPLFWEQQVATLGQPHTGMVVISDLVDDLTDIHPSYKWEVGRRLALQALAETYGEEVPIWSGPLLSGKEIVGDTIELSFTDCGEGLKANDGKRLNWFEIAGEDGIFHPALAEIAGKDKVVVHHPNITRPLHVRFGWHETAIPNLANSEGLPAFPFGAR